MAVSVSSALAKKFLPILLSLSVATE